MNTDILVPLFPFILGVFAIILGVTYSKEDRKNEEKLSSGLFSYIVKFIPV
ncbi:hypothetical protein RAH41_18845 [Gottfriedia acidiceleris]|uniref:hypothetical protein n=1 Tax=Gottfriedia acidiceleris TaxID=371036 RepID=UPI002F261A02